MPPGVRRMVSAQDSAQAEQCFQQETWYPQPGSCNPSMLSEASQTVTSIYFSDLLQTLTVIAHKEINK